MNNPPVTPKITAPSIGVAIITKDAEAHLEECLRSVKTWVDDIVILDSGSTDRTLEIAQAAGARIISTSDWPGFGPQKNRAISHLHTEWILSLDADEVVSSELAQSILHATGSDLNQVYALARLSNFCGRWMRHSGWYPDHVYRLFRQGCARFSDDLVHERLLFEHKASALPGVLKHYSFDNLDQVIEKMNRYSSAGALQRYQNGKHSKSILAALAKSLWSFFRTYLFRRGFLDGREGFILAIANAEGTFYRQLKLIQLNKNTNENIRHHQYI